jgi:hypothetical protein
MANGGIGLLVVVVPPVEKRLNFGPDSATAQLRLMEEQIALEKIQILLLAAMRNVMVKQHCKIKKGCQLKKGCQIKKGCKNKI